MSNPARPDVGALPQAMKEVLCFVSDASVAIDGLPLVAWVDDDGEWWAGLPQSYIRLSNFNWTVDRWQPLSTATLASGEAAEGSETYDLLMRLRDYLDINRRPGNDFSPMYSAEISVLLAKIEAAPPKPAPDALREATPAQHVGRPKGEPAKFVRNGKLETCQCFDCRALAAPVPSPDVPDGVLPCDVHLPPNTFFRKGVSFDAFMAGLRARYSFPAESTVFQLPSDAGAAEPVAWEKYIPDIVKNAMLTMWNEICSDTDCHPLDITHGTGKILWFTPHHWAELTGNMVARNITDLYAAPPVRGDREAIETARQEVVLAIAFLTRDGNTDRITETVRQLIPRLANADEKLRSLSLPVQPGAGERDICPYCDSEMEKDACSACGRKRVPDEGYARQPPPSSDGGER